MFIKTKLFIPLLASLAILTSLVGCSKDENEQQAVPVAQAEVYQELDWEELVPKQDRPDPNTMEREENMIMKSFGFKPPENTVAELNNQKIKIPGFIVPLETQGEVVTEFLLVPYYGACIHTPPPPKNQLIYVKTPGFSLDELYLPVWVEGTMQVTDTTSAMGDSGYLIESATVTIYED